MATNRPDTLDPALMRPGRLDRKVEFSLPDLDGRTNIFKIHARSMSVEKDIRYLITKIYLYMILNWGLSNHNLCSLPRVGFSCRRARSGLPKMGLLADLISHITYLQRTGPSKAQGGGELFNNSADCRVPKAWEGGLLEKLERNSRSQNLGVARGVSFSNLRKQAV